MSVLKKITNSDWNRGVIIDYSKRLVVTNVPAKCTAEMLKPLFSQCGQINNFKLVGRDPRSHIQQERKGETRTNLLFVEYEKKEQADEAIGKLNGHEIDGVKLIIKVQLSPEERNKQREERERKRQEYLQRKEYREAREAEHQAYLQRKARREARAEQEAKEREAEHEAYLQRKARREAREAEQKEPREPREQRETREPREPRVDTRKKVRNEDWFCSKCKTLNFAHREKCLKKMCEGVAPPL